MKIKNKIIIVIVALSVMMFGCVVIGVANSLNTPKHVEAGKIFHVSQEKCYYVQNCAHCNTVQHDTDMDFIQILQNVEKCDKIILDEDIYVANIILDDNFVSETKNQIDINLDLNNYSITSNANKDEGISLFDIQANNYSVNLNIENGSLYANKLLYVFNFTNSNNKTIHLNLNNVTSKTIGNNTTPLFAHNTSENIVVNATNCEFIAEKSASVETKNTGAFINSESEFNFNNCTFEGGDGVYVKQGKINFVGCTLINNNLGKQGDTLVKSDTFISAGRCLVADSYNYTQDEQILTTKFNITIDKCIFIAKTSNVAVIIDANNEGKFNENSIINIKSAKFTSANIEESLNKSIVTMSTSIKFLGENSYQIGEDF